MSDLNAVKWQGPKHRGHYEVWYITLVDPKTRHGFWFRYTVLSPELTSSAIPAVSLWAFQFVPDDPMAGVEGRNDFMLEAFKDTSKKGFSISLGNGSLDDKGARGTVGEGEKQISWDLKFGASAQSWEHFSPRLYERGFSQSCVNSPRLAMPISGTVTVGESKYELEDVPGEQSHTWGRSPTDTYAWAHCNAFEEDASAVFEGLNARVRKGPMRLPAAGPILFRSAEESLEVRDFFDLFAVKSSQDYGEWSFEAQSETLLLKGCVQAPRASFVAVEYADPTKERRVHCHNTIIADMTLEIYHRNNGWKLKRTLHSRGTTAFEIARPERDAAALRALGAMDGVWLAV